MFPLALLRRFTPLGRPLATVLPTFVTPLAPLPLPYTSRAGSLVPFTSPFPLFPSAPLLHALLRSQSRFVRVLPAFAGSRSTCFTREGWPARIRGQAQLRSPRGLSLRAMTLALHGSILCLQQPSRRLFYSLSCSKSPAGPVHGSNADGVLV